MPILFGTLAAIVMAIAAWTTFKNQDEYKYQIGQREKQEAILEKNLREEQDRKDELKKEQDATQQLVSDNKGLTEDLAKKEAERSKLATEIAAKEKLILDIKAEVDKANETLKELGDIETLVPKIKRIKGEIAQLQDDIEKEEANLASLKQLKKVTQSQIDVKVGEAEKIALGKSQTKLKTSIKTVYSNWGFVTLNGGDVQGVVPGSTLDVMRGDDVIAKLKVTTVEPNRAAADIVRDSVKDELFLRSGDRVVAEAEPEVVEPAKKAVAPVAAPAAPAPAAPQPEDNPFGN